MILLVIASGGVIRWMLQDSGLGNIIGPALEKSGLPLILIAFSDRNPGKGICRKLHCGNDHGIRNHGDYAGSNGYKHALQSCYVLCDLRWCNCTESCK